MSLLPSFNSLKELEQYLKNQVKEALSKDVKKEVVDIYRKSIAAKVYAVYTPIEYKRRYSLLQSQNIISTISESNNNVQLIIINKAPYNPAYESTPANLPELIEFGHGYNGNFYDYPYYEEYLQPRPFTAETIEQLDKTKKHVKTLQHSLKNKGIDA